MSINKTYAVFGLGRYGLAVAKELSASGIEVIAVDNDRNIVNTAASELPVCKCADVTDPEVIKQLDISDIDVVIISMAGCLEASVMAITLCKEVGVPTVIVKCASEMQGKIFIRVGADKVVFPEKESGVRLAKNLLSSGFIDMISISKDVSMVELDVKDEWVGKSLIDLNLRKKYDINVVAVRNEQNVQVGIDPAKPLDKEGKLIVIANTAKLAKLK